MEHHIKQTNSNKLPIVYPVIFYTGNRSYNYSTDLFDLFGDKKELAKDILWQPCRLIDLSKIPDKKLKEFLRYGIIARTMKHIYEKDFLPVLKEIVCDLKNIGGQDEITYIHTVLSYIIEAGELDKQEFIQTANAGLTQEVNIMTLAEQFRQEGRQEGYEKAKATLAEQFKREGYEEAKAMLAKQFKAEGKLEAAKTIAGRLLRQGMTHTQIADIMGLSVQEVKNLKADVSGES
jgi:predicted transposase/invertase (TIGR01784 family)